MNTRTVKAVLYEKVRGGPRMTPRDWWALDFAYANLALSTNHKPSRAAFRQLAYEKGATYEEWRKWADAREWSEDVTPK